MFLVKDDPTEREKKILDFVQDEPAIAVILAAVHFEWTVRRAIIALGMSPSRTIREHLECCHGLDAFKDVWKGEVKPRVQRNLAEVVSLWPKVRCAFKLRGRLVHGGKPTGSDYATDRVKWLLQAARDVRQFCETQKVNLHQTLPGRRKSRPLSN